MIKLMKYLKPFTLFIIGIITLVFLQTLSELYLPTLMAHLVDKGITQGNIPFIIATGSRMLMFTLFGALCAILGSFLSSRTAMAFGRDLRKQIFSTTTSFSLHEFDKMGAATLITRTTNDVTQVQMVLMMIMRMMIGAPLMCIGGIIMAISVDKKLSLVFLAVLPLLALLIILIFSKGVPLFKAMQVKIDKINLVLRENLTGIRVIRSFNRVDNEKKRFKEANEDLTANAIKVNKLMALMMPLMILIMNLTGIAIIWFGGNFISRGEMHVGSLMAFIQYSAQILFSLMMLSMMFVMIPRAQASAVRINEILNMTPEIRDPVTPRQEYSKKGTLEFENVTFSFPGAEQPAIHNISFKTQPGELTAIIGGTGSGKTAMMTLVPRFYDPDSGRVLIDGIDVREFFQEDLRNRIGLVPQKTILFTGTIADNIRYGRKDATEKEIEHAADIAQATEFISTLKDGMSHEISQGGKNISGGQKQRIAIARALVRNVGIYIFDDSFSALDFKTAADLRRALKKKTTESSVLIIAQRVTSIMDADRIIVLDEGRIVGMGSHKELLQTCDVYKEIAHSQLTQGELS